MRGRELGVAARLGMFAAGLAVVFVASFGVGRAVVPEDEAPPTTTTPLSTTTTGTPHAPAGHDMDHWGTGS